VLKRITKVNSSLKAAVITKIKEEMRYILQGFGKYKGLKGHSQKNEQ
jgi:hypothetical protein